MKPSLALLASSSGSGLTPPCSARQRFGSRRDARAVSAGFSRWSGSAVLQLVHGGVSRHGNGLGAMFWAQQAAVLLCGVGAAASWRKLYTGELHWDGQQWWAEPTASTSVEDASAVHPRLCFDAFNLFFLRLDVPGGGRSQWCGLQRVDDPALWGDLRRALYSSGTASGTPPAAPDTGMGAN